LVKKYVVSNKNEVLEIKARWRLVLPCCFQSSFNFRNVSANSKREVE